MCEKELVFWQVGTHSSRKEGRKEGEAGKEGKAGRGGRERRSRPGWVRLKLGSALFCSAKRSLSHSFWNWDHRAVC